MRFLPILLLIALAGCGSGKTQLAGEAECRQQAYKDPQVQQQMAAQIPGTWNNVFNKDVGTPHMEAQDAIKQATLDCMRRRGFATPGGVEPVKNYPYSPLGF